MKQNTRKLVGVVATLVLLVVYSLAASGIFLLLPPDLPPVGVILYFAVAGLAWVLPEMAIIRFMLRPDARPQ